jgi:HPt (histidine-containing phosphotransfer) domain-containing protein
MNEFKQLDLELLAGYRSNLAPNILQQMLVLYEQQAKQYMQQIKDALMDEPAVWQERCHKMKGAAGSVGFIKVHALLASMEKSITGYPQKLEALAQLQQHNQQAQVEFERWLSNNE